MKIISLANGHDASVTALENGKILYHWELERVLNKKHFCGVDHSNEIAGVLYEHCLPILGWSPDEIDILVFAGHSEWRKTEFYGKVPTYEPLNYAKPYAEGKITLRNSQREIPCYSVIHHVNHAAYAYFTSPYDSSIVYTHDGLGDLISALWGVGSKNKLTIRGELTIEPGLGIEPNAIGLTYSYLNRVFPFLGGDLLAVAGKFMGLSSYGTPRDEWRSECRKVLTKWMPETKFLPDALGINRSELNDAKSKVAQDLAATIQDEAELLVCSAIEKIVDKVCGEVHFIDETPDRLCMAGGCALNVCINSRLVKQTHVEDCEGGFTTQIVQNLYVPPATSDCGISIGAALYVWHHILDNPFSGMKWHDPFLGDYLYNGPPGYQDCHITREVSSQDAKSNEYMQWIKENYPNLHYTQFRCEGELVDDICHNLLQDKLLAIAHGRSEIGPRALGNRSLICAVTNISFKDKMNTIKRREYWRPFANFILEREQDLWYDIYHPSYYMLECPSVRNNARAEKIPAIVHVDGTSRIQSINSEVNPLVNSILETYFAMTGIPTIMNTSLNIAGKPIASDTRDILELLSTSTLDAAYINGWKFWRK